MCEATAKCLYDATTVTETFLHECDYAYGRKSSNTATAKCLHDATAAMEKFRQ